MSLTRAKKLVKIFGVVVMFFLFVGWSFYLTDTSSIEIASVPQGAIISINGSQHEGQTPITVSGFRRGDTIIIGASLAGYQTQSREIQVQNKLERVRFLLVRQGVSSEVPPHPPPPSIKPSYLEKISSEPFWTMLPHWTDAYVIEYNHSNNIFFITLRDPEALSESEKTQLRSGAIDWLEQNGADTDTLNIQYR